MVSIDVTTIQVHVGIPLWCIPLGCLWIGKTIVIIRLLDIQSDRYSPTKDSRPTFYTSKPRNDGIQVVTNVLIVV